MAKDPAVLFYTSDFIVGTTFMTMEERGQYITLLCLQHQKGGIPRSHIKNLCGSLDSPVLEKFEVDEDDLYFNPRMRLEANKRRKYCESRSKSRKKSDEDNVRIYIVRDNVRSTYKIGSSVNPMRRYNELANQKNRAIMADKQGERDISLVWYSESMPRKVESKLHSHFEDKRIKGEWFNLDDDDLDYIYRTYKGTFQRTSARTEDVNVNENESKNKVAKETDNNVIQVFAHYKTTFNKNASYKLNTKRTKLIKDSIKLHGIDDTVKAITKMATDDWEGRSNYNDLSYAIGTVKGIDNVEKWLSYESQKKPPMIPGKDKKYGNMPKSFE